MNNGLRRGNAPIIFSMAPVVCSRVFIELLKCGEIEGYFNAMDGNLFHKAPPRGEF